MQLNKDNGHFIEIDKIKIDSNMVVYSEYENTIAKQLGLNVVTKSYVFTTIQLRNYLNQLINFTELCYDKLQEEVTTDFVISEDEKNWLFNRPVRVTILNSLVLEHLKPINAQGDLSELGQLIQRVRVQHYDYYEDNHNDYTTCIYFNTVEPTDYAVIEPFIGNGIYIETNV